MKPHHLGGPKILTNKRIEIEDGGGGGGGGGRGWGISKQLKLAQLCILTMHNNDAYLLIEFECVTLITV